MGAQAVSEEARSYHLSLFGKEAEAVVAAPGRINIIGEHTDYAGGHCLPAAVDRYVAVAASRGHGVVVASRAQGQAVNAEPDSLHRTGTWADHQLGVLEELRQKGIAVDARLAVASSIPEGTGLSSSAALEVATALVMLQLADVRWSPLDVARLCGRAENDFAGVPSGLMDQVASILGRGHSALLFDAATTIVEAVPLPARFGWLVAESGVSRQLRGTDYSTRTQEAQQALELARQREPGLFRLTELSLADVERLQLPEPLNRRARHIASEEMRVRMAVACIEAANLEALGELMLHSHRSLARDCEVSTKELDMLVDVALQSGCAGARLMGAGFGGSVVALVEAEKGREVAAAIRERGFLTHRVTIVDGADTWSQVAT